jgi:Holliday junction resolvase
MTKSDRLFVKDELEQLAKFLKDMSGEPVSKCHEEFRAGRQHGLALSSDTLSRVAVIIDQTLQQTEDLQNVVNTVASLKKDMN